MTTEKRFKEIKKSNKNISEETKKELNECIEKGNKMSEENDRLFRRLLN